MTAVLEAPDLAAMRVREAVLESLARQAIAGEISAEAAVLAAAPHAGPMTASALQRRWDAYAEALELADRMFAGTAHWSEVDETLTCPDRHEMATDMAFGYADDALAALVRGEAR